jgi:demethylspheroidene O-methyltransferase
MRGVVRLAAAPAKVDVAVAPSLAQRWRSARDRLLASPRFQRWAATFPLTRPIARRRAAELFDLCAGFVYSQVLYACVRSRLFEHLAGSTQPLPAQALAPLLGLSEAGTTRLLAAAVALRLVERRGANGYGLGVLGAALLGNPGVAAMIEHHAALYEDLHDPLALLRSADAEPAERPAGALSRYWPYAQAAQPSALAPQQVDAYTTLMSTSQPLVAGAIIGAYPFARHRCLLDVGGGDGTFAATVAAQVPGLRVMVFDLPAVVARARARFADTGLADRAVAYGGDFVSDPLPTGADLLTLVRVLHDHDDARVLALLRSAQRALPENGTLLIAEPMAQTPGAERMGDAYFGFYLLAMGRGQPRSVARLAQLLAAAGFDRVRFIATPVPLQVSLLAARRCRSHIPDPSVRLA